MPFLSKIPLNPLRRGAQRLLRSPEAMHAAVLGGLPPFVEGRILWRDETIRMPGGPATCHVLVLTPAEPDWSHLIEQAGWDNPSGTPLVRNLNPLLDLVAVGRQFGFRVRANPVRAIRQLDGPTDDPDALHPRPRGVRVAHRTAAHQIEWFVRRSAPEAPHWGFTIEQAQHPSLSLVHRERVTFSKGRQVRRPVTLNRATFEGVLTVVDPARLREVLLTGLGGGKAYGCGLLTLDPRQSHVVAG